MKNIVAFFLAVCWSTSYGFLPVRPTTKTSSTLNLFGSQRGDSSPIQQRTNATSFPDATTPEVKQPRGYQRIEDWDAERNAKGELSWEERVQFDGQRLGNQIQQNDILMRQLNTF
jgi:hypothetical protein